MNIYLEGRNMPADMKDRVKKAITKLPTGMPVGGESLAGSIYTQEDKRTAELIEKTRTYLHGINGDATMTGSETSTLEERDELKKLLQEKIDSLNEFVASLEDVDSVEKERAHKAREEEVENDKLAKLSKVEKSLGI